MEPNPCYYCGRLTTNPPERVDNKKLWVCDRTECQQELYDYEDKVSDANERYDEWRTRGE